MIASLITTMLVGVHNGVQSGLYAGREANYSRAELLAEARRREVHNAAVRRESARRRALAVENARLRQQIEIMEAQRILDRL